MSRTAITLKFRMYLFLDEASYWAEKLLTDINLLRLMPDVDNNLGASLEMTTSRATQELVFKSLMDLETKSSLIGWRKLMNNSG